MPNDLSRGWIKGHKYNKDLVADSDNILFGSVDVVFVGDDVTEAWNGRQLGVETSAYKAVNSYFLKTFSRNGGGEIDGLALGTTADSVCYATVCTNTTNIVSYHIILIKPV
jgi:hypothetical protein